MIHTDGTKCTEPFENRAALVRFVNGWHQDLIDREEDHRSHNWREFEKYVKLHGVRVKKQ